ncbi:hypothetical protein D0Y65_042201 [Glycine soja]|uniref:Bifunctional inhibitor/plant lipid transfer protein/seed storage helical domain-containing protein n=1 Tax=Glycine soja TaxID=3848 RepID=A0A445GZ03_GLYSO|nr:hypothetical protein D0Y65_042201 [Glycine soja]
MAGLVAQVQSSPCTSTFFSALVQLIPCRAAVAPFSPIPPSDSCCNALKALGQPCLCVLVNGPPISGVDRNMASQLPDKCTANFEPSAMYVQFWFFDLFHAFVSSSSKNLSLMVLEYNSETSALTFLHRCIKIAFNLPFLWGLPSHQMMIIIITSAEIGLYGGHMKPSTTVVTSLKVTS